MWCIAVGWCTIGMTVTRRCSWRRKARFTVPTSERSLSIVLSRDHQSLKRGIRW